MGVDFNLWRDQLAIRTDVFDFANQRLKWPRVRTSLQFTFLQHLYLNAGVDDIFNRPVYSQLDNRVLAGRDFFLGAGIVFTDDDLKAVVPFVPCHPTDAARARLQASPGISGLRLGRSGGHRRGVAEGARYRSRNWGWV